MPKDLSRRLRRHGGATYLEGQSEYLCGKHSLNHILQEEKFVWDDYSNDLYIPPLAEGADERAHLFNPWIKVNLRVACAQYVPIAKRYYIDLTFDVVVEKLISNFHEDVTQSSGYIAASAESKAHILRQDTIIKTKYAGMTDAQIRDAYRAEMEAEVMDPAYELPEPPCTYEEGGKGNFDINMLEYWGNKLGFTTELIAGQEEEEGIFPIEVADRIINPDDPDVHEGGYIYQHRNGKHYGLLYNPTLLGAVFNTIVKYSGHYTALVIYDEDCEPERVSEPDVQEKTYAYIDSLDCTVPDTNLCYKPDELFDLIADMSTLKGTIFLHITDNCYQSVSVLRASGNDDAAAEQEAVADAASAEWKEKAKAAAKAAKQATKSAKPASKGRHRTTLKKAKKMRQ